MAAPPAAEEHRARPAAELEREAAQYEAPPPAPAPKPAPEPAQRRSMPISAPVSRDVPSVNGGKVQDFNRIDLTPEESTLRCGATARPDMTRDQKIAAYAANKRKLLQMRATGQYRPTTDQTG